MVKSRYRKRWERYLALQIVASIFNAYMFALNPNRKKWGLCHDLKCKCYSKQHELENKNGFVFGRRHLAIIDKMSFYKKAYNHANKTFKKKDLYGN